MVDIKQCSIYHFNLPQILEPQLNKLCIKKLMNDDYKNIFNISQNHIYILGDKNVY